MDLRKEAISTEGRKLLQNAFLFLASLRPVHITRARARVTRYARE
jgi:hypothetical protein